MKIDYSKIKKGDKVWLVAYDHRFSNDTEATVISVGSKYITVAIGEHGWKIKFHADSGYQVDYSEYVLYPDKYTAEKFNAYAEKCKKISRYIDRGFLGYATQDDIDIIYSILKKYDHEV